MGMPNSGLFLPEEMNFLSRHTLGFQDHGCQIPPPEDGELEEEEKEKCEIIGSVSSLELIKRPSLGEFMEDDNDEGFRTPTSLDQRIPLIPAKCPPAPRKSKSSLPLMKRRSVARRRRILLDLSNEIESLFPPADLGGKIKKVRKANATK